MDIDEFWRLNEALPPDGAEKVLEQRLRRLSPEEIVSYQHHFYKAFTSAYRWQLWGAAYLMDGGCSDDGFMDFRYGLIACGRIVFEAALADPDSLADMSILDGVYIPNESFGYVVQRVYKDMTGSEMPDSGVDFPDAPAGDEWDFDDDSQNMAMLPKLWAKFGE
jgi:hypothetical protein